jgi:hypothetical protein
MPRAYGAGGEPDDTGTQHVWYASFGSNILLERFQCYLEGGRVAGMIRDMARRNVHPGAC